MLVNYEWVKPPLSVPLNQTTKKQAKEYFNWFMRIIPIRIAILQQALHQNESQNIMLDFSSDSFRPLGKWLDSHIVKRLLTKKEREEEKTHQPGWVHDYLEEWILTEETFSLCFDVGVYFGESLRQHKAIDWKIRETRKSDIDYHQPVLAPFANDMYLNPIAIITNVAYGVIRGKNAEERLPKLYCFWNDQARDIVTPI